MTVTPILQPGQIETAAGDIPELRLPPATLFSHRAQRLRQLAEGHSLGDYLRFIADLAECQQSALDQHPEIPLPDADLIASCREYASCPLRTAGWHRHPHWQRRHPDSGRGDVRRAFLPQAGKPSPSFLLPTTRNGWRIRLTNCWPVHLQISTWRQLPSWGQRCRCNGPTWRDNWMR